MSELIAEARVLVTPDTAAFRSLLISQTTSAAAGVIVPVAVQPVFSGAAAAAGAAGLAAAQGQLAESTTAADGALRLQQLLLSQGAVDMSRYAVATETATTATSGFAASQRASAAAAATHARQLKGLSSGAASSALSLVGLRGATLAASAPFLAGAAAAIAFTAAVRSFANLESQLSVFAATTGATADQLERVSETALELGSDLTLPGVTAQDAAEAMTEFAKAGLSVSEAMAATRGGLQLATAAQISNAEAVELSANALNAFNLAGNQAVHVADVLANAANLAQGGIQDTALALRQAAAAAQVVGVSFEDTSALLTLLARNGLQSSDAGTSLRTAFLRLVNPSKEANKVIASLGINLRDAAGNVRPEVFAEFAQAQSDLSAKTQQANAAIVFGQDAFRAFGILGAEGTNGLRQVQEGLEETGTAARLAGARMSGLQGAQEKVSNSLSGVGTTFGGFVSGPLQRLLEGLADGITLSGRFAVALGDLGTKAKGAADEIRGIDLPGPIDPTDLFPDLTTFLPPQAQEAAKFFALFRDQSTNIAVQRDRVKELVAEFNKIGGASQLNTTVVSLQKIADGLAGGDAQAKAFGASIQDLIKDLQKSGQEGFEFEIKLPADVLNGGLGRELAQATSAGFASEINKGDFGVGAFIRVLREKGEKGFADAARAWARAAASAGKSAMASAAAQLSLDLALAQAGGDEGQELSVLRTREARQEEFLNNVLAREQTPKNVELAIKAAKQLAETRAQITAILEGNAADAEQARNEQERIAKEQQASAAQTFLGRQTDARARQERLVGLASETEGLQDDIKRRQGLRTLITQQIAALRQSSLDEKTKQAAIKALVAAKQATSDEINKLVRTQAQQNREQRDAAQEEREAANIALGESILDLTGNKNPLLRALDAAIRDAVKEKNQAKKGSLAFIAAQTEINQLLKRRKDVLESLDDEKLSGGKSLAEFLTENTDLFNQLASSGGIGGVDPLTGFDFSSSIVAATKKMQDAVKVQQAQAGGQQANRLPDAIDRLINALERNTDAKNGNGTTGDGVGGGTTYAGSVAMTKRAQALGDFWQARQARVMEQARYDGGGGV